MRRLAASERRERAMPRSCAVVAAAALHLGAVPCHRPSACALLRESRAVLL